MWEVEQGILINGQFPGPQIDAVTNDNLIISVYNYLREPFLISWYKSSFFPLLYIKAGFGPVWFPGKENFRMLKREESLLPGTKQRWM